MSATNWGVALAVLTAVPGCYSTAGPVQWLPTAEETETSAYGGWFEPEKGSVSGGELLAVTEDSILFLGAGGVEVVHRAAVAGGRVIGWNSRAGDLNGVGVLGTLSTLSNGLFLLFTAPAWMVTTGMANTTQYRLPIVPISGATTDQIARFARFPQGWPAGLRRDQLRPKPLALPGTAPANP